MTNDGPVFVIDDDPAVRQSVHFLLTATGLRVVAFESAEAFLRTLPAEAYDGGVAVIDIRMPGMSGLELQQQLLRSGLPLAIVFLSGHGDLRMCAAAMRTGAINFLEKPFEEQDLLTTIDRALEKATLWASQRRERQVFARRRALLSPREAEVMDLLVACHPSKVVAARLGVSIKTIDKHRQRMLEKMQVESLVELARLVERCGNGAQNQAV